jgi:16S rRNA processing protein RimM
VSEPSRLLEVGKVGKAHGLKGEVVVDFTTDLIEERTAPGTELHADERRLVIDRARPHHQKWLVLFEGIADREGAEQLRGKVLRAVAIDDPEAEYAHDLIGKTAVDQHGAEHGEVVAVVDNPASDLLELADGRLIPLAFVVGSGPSSVEVSVPPGLLDDDAADGATD